MMVDHRMDSWLYIVEAVAAMKPAHDHLLMKDPRRLGWGCRVVGCGFFKSAREFDGIALVTSVAAPTGRT